MKRLMLVLLAAGLTAVALTVVAAAPASPTCTNATASPNLLWPPNHKLVTITVFVPEDGAGADPNVTTIIGVSQDESLNDTGDGNTPGFDARLRTGPRPSDVHKDTVEVRAERSGNGDGRIYEITYRSQDNGGSCIGKITVGVPHSQGNPNSKKGGSVPRDSGVRFNSLG